MSNEVTPTTPTTGTSTVQTQAAPLPQDAPSGDNATSSPATPPRARTGHPEATQQARWTVTLEAAPDHTGTPPLARLRRALKGLWRGYRLKVIGISEVKHEG